MRIALLALLFGLAACAPSVPSPGPTPSDGPVAGMANPAAIAPQDLTLQAGDGREIPVVVWTAPDEQAVIVFSHGMGAEPRAYNRLLDRWVAAGFSVVAPLHVDSTVHPRRADFNGMTGYMARLEDVTRTIDHVTTAYPGRPVIAAGHSYGTLFALIQGGAATPFGPRDNLAVKGVMGLSSPGVIPGLINEETFDRTTTPFMIVTGDQDLVPGYVTDPRDHRLAFDQATEGSKYLLTFEGGDHSLPRSADAEDFETLVSATVDFMRTTALRDRAAWDRLKTFERPGVTLERR